MYITPATYAHWRGGSELGSVTERLEQEAVFSQLPNLRGWRVLDAGCGGGTYAIEASRRGAIVTGLDSSLPMLVAAWQRERRILGGAEISWCHGRVEALPFQDGSFDLVLAITLLCLVPAPSQVVGELARVLRPGGTLLLGELGRRSAWALVRRLRAWLGSGYWKQAHFWTVGELQTLLGHVQLDVKSTRGAVYYPPWAICAKLACHYDRSLSIMGGWGAAFIVTKAVKPLSVASDPPGATGKRA